MLLMSEVKVMIVEGCEELLLLPGGYGSPFELIVVVKRGHRGQSSLLK